MSQPEIIIKKQALEEIKESLVGLVPFGQEVFSNEQKSVLVYKNIPPRMSVSAAVNILKTNTSSGLKKKFPFLKKLYADEKGIWSVGYFVSTVGINEAVIRRYIKMQEKEDSGQAKLEI